MSYSLYSDEEEKLQKLLIPLNIVVAILALVAAISLLVTPLLKVDFGKVAEAVMAMTGGESSESDESSSSPYAAVFDNVDAELVISPIGMAKVLFAPADKKGATLLNELVLSKEIIEGISVSAVNMMLVVATKDVDAGDMDKIDMPALNEALIKVDDAESEEDVLKVLDDYLAVLEKQDVTITDDMREAAKEHTLELYNDTVEATGGDFSVEKMICVNMSPDGKVYDNYTDLVAGMLNGDLSSSEGSDNPLSSVAEMMNMIAAPYGFGFIYIAFNALIWFILFLFAFIRLFTKNKRFTMWYVKLVGCWPCIIFFLVPFAMGKAAASVAGLAPLSGLFGAISSFTWISGICYLLLWAFSICWAFPIKRKIRKLRKGGE